MFANKLEAMVARKLKSRTSFNFMFILNTLYVASILLMLLKFMSINMYSQKCTTGNPPYAHINAYLPLKSKYWLREGVGGQFPRNV